MDVLKGIAASKYIFSCETDVVVTVAKVLVTAGKFLVTATNAFSANHDQSQQRDILSFPCVRFFFSTGYFIIVKFLLYVHNDSRAIGERKDTSNEPAAPRKDSFRKTQLFALIVERRLINYEITQRASHVLFIAVV